MANALPALPFSHFFFFNDTATTEIYTLSLHDALPICWSVSGLPVWLSVGLFMLAVDVAGRLGCGRIPRSEEHTSELQSRPHLVCRLLLEKKKSPATTASSAEEQAWWVRTGRSTALLRL